MCAFALATFLGLIIPERAASAQEEMTPTGALAPAPTGGQRDPLFDTNYDEELASQPTGFPDPLEPMNRVTLRINRVIDHLILNPVTRLYDLLVPEPVEPAIRRVFRNLASGGVLLNELLQAHPRAAGRTAIRFFVNTTVGLGGAFDFARCEGVYRRNADFGQTLANYGVGSGPYLVLPVFGPSNARDAFGDLVDGLLHPAVYLLGPLQRLTYGGSLGIAIREEHYHSLDALEKSAVDFYAALRNAYYQVRIAEIEDGTRSKGPPNDDAYDAPCGRTLSGQDEPIRKARGLPTNPVSRWLHSETP
jgi:phospholipid-binding lipoprotein MlaA